MLFWIICLVMTSVVALWVVTPLLRPAQTQAENPDIAIYRAQLDEIDRDMARDLIAPDEAERAKTEVARRIIAASKAADPQTNKTGGGPAIAIAVAGIVLALGFGIYWQIGAPGYGDLPLNARLAASEEMRANRPNQAALEAAVPVQPAIEAPDEYLEAVRQLRVIAPTRPDDLQAWELLAYHETELRNFAAAARAQAQVVTIKGDDARLDEKARMLDLMVTAAGGIVSPEAQKVALQILDNDSQNTTARFYLGAMYNQTDRPDLAYRLWREMAENGDPGSFHVARARDLIEEAAFLAGVNYSLPALRGPNADDIANAQNMSPEDRQAMIGNMVAGLADRLANEGGTARDWARLITAYGVLGDTTSAQKIWTEARDVFGANEAAMDILTPAAQQAGLIE